MSKLAKWKQNFPLLGVKGGSLSSFNPKLARSFQFQEKFEFLPRPTNRGAVGTVLLQSRTEVGLNEYLVFQLFEYRILTGFEGLDYPVFRIVPKIVIDKDQSC